MDLHEGLHHHSQREHHHHGDVTAETSISPFIIQGVVLSLFMILEFTVGLIAHSVALVGDSFHMLVDVASAFVSAWIITLLRRPESDSHTFAFLRSDVLMAEGQGALFVVMAALTAWEGVHRLFHPESVNGTLMSLAATTGIVASVALLYVLRRAGSSMTAKANWLHEIQDLAGFAATAAAGLLIQLTHFSRWDAIASFLVAALMLRHAWETLRETGRILMESTPAGLNLGEIRDFIESQPVRPKVKNLHLWSLNEDVTSMSTHIVLSEGIDCHPLQDSIREFAADRLGITHVTVEVLHEGDPTPHLHEPSSEISD
jgi:cobalt-zinc-cadmium efflux system protein